MEEDHRAPRFPSGMQPISKVSLGQIVGLLKAVDEAGGDADVAEIARLVEMDLDSIGHIVDAAEFLGLARAEEGDLTITELGRKALSANLRQRKAILRDIIQDLPAFRRLIERITTAGGPVNRQEVLEALEGQFGRMDAPSMFNALVYWGRYVELLTYDSRSELLALRTPTPPRSPASPAT